MIDKAVKVYIAGHRGLICSAIQRRLQAGGYTNFITKTHKELDLLDQNETNSFFEVQRTEYVFLAAAKVGGIHANNTNPADFIYENLTVQTTLSIRRMRIVPRGCAFWGRVAYFHVIGLNRSKRNTS